MDPTPAPLTQQLDPEDVARHRSVACTEYDGCLDVVLRRRWRSWTCARCKLFALAREFEARRAVHDGALRPFAT